MAVLLLAMAIFPLAATAASTNLNYTADQINAALSIALDNSNTVATVAANHTAITNEVDSAGVAEVGFVSVDINTNFTATSWTAIDVSGTVGTNAALVYLQVEDTSGSANDVLFRTTGMTNEVGLLDGVTAAQIDANDNAYFIVQANAAGSVDCKVDGACSITAQAFIRRREF